MAKFPTRVLLATDGSAQAQQAAEMAAELSGRHGAELHVVYVEPVPEAYVNAWSSADAEFSELVRGQAEKDAQAKADREVAKIKETGHEVTRAHGKVGQPEAEIVRLAEEIGAGLTVIGSRGLGPLRRALIGSVSNGVVRHAHSSVLVVRGSGRLPGKILLANDGSEGAESASEVAAEIAATTGSELTILVALSLVTPYPSRLAQDTWGNTKHQASSFAEQEATRLSAETSTTVEGRLVLGRPDVEIVRAGEDLGADMIVVGSRGIGAVRRAVMGSVSDSVVRHAHCPVLVVRPER